MRLRVVLWLLVAGIAVADPVKGELPAAALYGRVAPSVVVVESTLQGGRLQGSGVVIGPELIVTNHHVINGAVTIEVRQGKRRWSAKVEAIHPKHDLALLRVTGLDLPRVSLRPSANVTVGERVFALGAPRGLELSLSDGLVAALRREKDDGPARIQTTTPVSPGSSGGGLFDAHGQLIGIITLSADGQNLNFAHPTEWVQELRSHGAPPPPAKAHQYDVAHRPDQLRCRLDTEATWALFSGGAEMLESTSIGADWGFYNLSSQTPASVPQTGGGFPSEELVLYDLNRSAGWVAFVPSNQPKAERLVYFNTDDDDRFRVTVLVPFDFHGQLRVRAESGSCVWARPQPRVVVVSADLTPDERCQRGDAEVCISLARGVEHTDQVSALKLYLTGCDGSSPPAAEACERAAKICDGLKYTNRAVELRDRGRRLTAQGKSDGK